MVCRITGCGIYESEGCEFVYTVMSQSLGYPTHRSGLVVPELRGVWTEASACALCQPSVMVQVFRAICRYMCSPRVVEKFQN